MAPTDSDVRVGVVGAGYAGLRAAMAARAQGAEVTIYDPTGAHEFATRLAAVAGGRAPSGDGWADAQELTGIEVERVAVDQVDGAGPALHLEDGRTEIFDAIVVAGGARPAFPAVPGVERHTLTLKTTADALAIRRELIEADHVIVVGGGATGVQLAAEAAHRHRHLEVTLVEAASRLLPIYPAPLGHRAQKLLERRGVDVRLDTAVDAVTADAAHLEDGTELEGLVIWATGFAADGTAVLPGVPTRDGRLIVDRDLRVPGTIAVFAAGDIAAHNDLFGCPLPMSAQIADRAGAIAGRNAARMARGLPTSPAVLVDLGWVVAMGKDIGVAQVGPLRLASSLTDRLVPLLHDLIDIRHLFQVGGVDAVLAHGAGRHRPERSMIRRIERPQIRSVS
jgi:NADH dehydrogenase